MISRIQTKLLDGDSTLLVMIAVGAGNGRCKIVTANPNVDPTAGVPRCIDIVCPDTERSRQPEFQPNLIAGRIAIDRSHDDNAIAGIGIIHVDDIGAARMWKKHHQLRRIRHIDGVTVIIGRGHGAAGGIENDL